MLELAMYTTIQTLWKQGYSKAKIAEITGHDWKTVSKVIKLYKSGQLSAMKKAHPSRLDDFKANIMEWLEQGLTSVRIHEELQVKNLPISYSSVKKYISKIKGKNDICIRFYTEAGEEAQVDFGYVGILPDPTGKRRKAWVFNMRLSYSRLDYYAVVYNQTVETFISCHVNAFTYFKGVPKYIKLDNLKAAILEANFYEPTYQNLYKQLATYYKFEPLPCRVRKPQEKGKTEAGIKFIKNNFFKGRDFNNYEDLIGQLKFWLENKCNNRIHGTTRKVPREVYIEEEQKYLIPLPVTAFIIPEVSTRKVYRDCHVYVNYNYYSVPYGYVGKTVTIEVTEQFIKIFFAGAQIAIHPKATGRGQFITQINHFPPYKCISSTTYQQEYQIKMANIGEFAEKIYLSLLKEQPYHWQQTVKGILSLRKEYSDELINLSCKRALAYGVLQYRKIKNIGANGYCYLPIDQTMEVYH